jgi:hypothetical protein
MVETTSPIWSRSEKERRKIKQINTKKKWIEWVRSREIWIIQRIVVFPALSRPRTRIRASLLPKTDENNLVNTNPIFRFGRWMATERLRLEHESAENSFTLTEKKLKSDQISKQILWIWGEDVHANVNLICVNDVRICDSEKVKGTVRFR